MLVKFITHSSSETKKAGEKLARLLLQKRLSLSKALVITLEGNLGGGKTTFLQGLAKVFQIEKILSPTFIIYREYRLKGLPFRKFYHFDFYRLQEASQVQQLGWPEKLADPQNIIAVEWGDKFPALIPKKRIQVKFKLTQLKEREITIQTPSSFSKNDQ